MSSHVFPGTFIRRRDRQQRSLTIIDCLLLRKRWHRPRLPRVFLSSLSLRLRLSLWFLNPGLSRIAKKRAACGLFILLWLRPHSLCELGFSLIYKVDCFGFPINPSRQRKAFIASIRTSVRTFPTNLPDLSLYRFSI